MDNVNPDLNEEVESLLEEFSTSPERLTAPTPRSRKRRKLWLAFLSFVGFLAVLYLRDWGWRDVLMFVGVLLFHEAGHIVAMKILGYENPAVLFIPFLGAVAFTEKKQASLTDKVLVNLAGPLPGLAIGLPLLVWLNSQGLLETSDWRVALSAFLVVLNLFNLLPIYPLDGGQVANDLIFSRFNFSLLIFQVSGFLILLIWGILIRNLLFCLFALLVAAAIPRESDKSQVKRKLKQKRLNIGRMKLIDFIRALLSTIQEIFPKQERVGRIVLARSILNDCRDLEASLFTRIALIGLYFIALFGTFFVLFGIVFPIPFAQFTPEDWLTFFNKLGSQLIRIIVQNLPVIVSFIGLLILLRNGVPRLTKKLPQKVQYWLAIRQDDCYLLYLRIPIILGQETAAIRQCRAWSFKERGDFQKAIAESNKAMEIEPYNPDVYEQRYLLYEGRAFEIKNASSPEPHQYIKLAIEALDTLIELRPQKKEYYCKRGELKHFLADYESALEDCNYSLNNSPNLSRGYKVRGWIHERLGNYESALQDYSRYIALDREDAYSYYDRGFGKNWAKAKRQQQIGKPTRN